ncbi:MAG: hypothetical protein MJE12_15430, partial [Alphaproteobacteria bacterium]|nr:hypothetical protein [Alphaproteobacteria bacterium]
MPDQDISITFVTTDLNTGGAERHLAMLLPVLSQRGMTVSVYVVGDDGPMSQPLRAAGIPVRCLMQESRWIHALRSPFRGLAAYLISVIHLHREIRRARAAVCHA